MDVAWEARVAKLGFLIAMQYLRVDITHKQAVIKYKINHNLLVSRETKKIGVPFHVKPKTRQNLEKFY